MVEDSLVERVVWAVHKQYQALKDADSHGEVDAACYAIANDIESWIYGSLKDIDGGYQYLGAASTQLCFPLKNGGELRFSVTDGDVLEGVSHDAGWDAAFDHYDGALSGVGVSGPVSPTGGKDE